jgi:hypothetical protein
MITTPIDPVKLHQYILGMLYEHRKAKLVEAIEDVMYDRDFLSELDDRIQSYLALPQAAE